MKETLPSPMLLLVRTFSRRSRKANWDSLDSAFLSNTEWSGGDGDILLLNRKRRTFWNTGFLESEQEERFSALSLLPFMKGMDPTLLKDSHEPKINKSKVVAVTESLFLSPGAKYQLCLSRRIQHGLSEVHSTGKG